jgi:hypothetical protein
VVGDVNPGPVVGTLVGAEALEPEPELLFELEPQALTTSATSATVQAANTVRENFRMLRTLLRDQQLLGCQS